MMLFAFIINRKAKKAKGLAKILQKCITVIRIKGTNGIAELPEERPARR